MLNTKDATMCSKCLMTDNYPDISFDENGLCRYCIEHTTEQDTIDWDAKQKELEIRIENIKNEATSYHAVVPWSGGKDSSYVLYVLKKVYGLNVLAVNFDNGLKSEQAIKNMDMLSRNLEVDVVMLRPDSKLIFDIYSHYLREKGELCSVCNVVGYVMIYSYLLQLQQSLGYLPLVVGGWSGTHENVRSILTFDYGELKSVLEKDPELLERFENNNMVNKQILKIFEEIGDPRVGSQTLNADMAVKFFHLPEFMEWDVVKIKKILEDEVDWSAITAMGAHEDCIWHDSLRYLMLKKYGIDNDTIAISAMIRSGSISKEEGLEMQKAMAITDEPEEMESILDMLGCPKEDINFDSTWYTGDNVGKTIKK